MWICVYQNTKKKWNGKPQWKKISAFSTYVLLMCIFTYTHQRTPIQSGSIKKFTGQLEKGAYPNIEMDKGLKSHLTKHDIQITSRHTERSLVIRQKQIKTTVRYHRPLTSLAKMKITDNIKSGWTREALGSSCTSGGSINTYNHSGKCSGSI